MSVVLIVGSEKQLSSGIPWCKQIAETSHCPIQVVVLGSDSKVLVEHSRRRVADAMQQPVEQVEVVSLPPDVEPIKAHLKSVRCSTLAMVYAIQNAALQQQLFEGSSVPTFWLRVSGPPPDAPGRLFAALGRSNIATVMAAETLFGFGPAAILPDPFQSDSVAAASETQPSERQASDAEPSAGDPTDEVVQRVIAQIDSAATHRGDLVLVGIDDTLSGDRVYEVARQLLDHSGSASIALVHRGEALHQSLGPRIRDWFASVAPPMEREERLDLASDLDTGSRPNLEFVGLISASSMLAAFGLLQNSAAVIIGAMLIAPLMTPIIGAGLALAHGNRPLFRSALITIALGFASALGASLLFGLFARFLEQGLGIDVGIPLRSTPEMLARTRPSPLDFCVGMVGGLAASYARTRRHLSSALAGAAIAAALVPPIATAGLQLAFGAWEPGPDGDRPVIGPLLLVFINVLTIMIGSSFILWARGMRGDRKLPPQDRWVPRAIILLLLLVSLTLMLLLL
jgi:uncharacterized hydrophobic protein (TIGR00271 family)